ncbi:MAG: hypothetical protein AAB446_01435 [Patescibacteria group bacterium]
MKKNLGLKIFIIILVLLTICFVTAFIGFSVKRDVSLSKNLWGGYEYQKEYVLEQDVFLMSLDKLSGTAGERLAIVPEKSFHGRSFARMNSSPNTIAEYKQNPEKASKIILTDGSFYPIEVKGILKKGTRFQTYKLEEHYQYSLFGYDLLDKNLYYYVKIIDGEFAGAIATIEDISFHYEEDGIFKYEPEELLVSPNFSN